MKVFDAIMTIPPWRMRVYSVAAALISVAGAANYLDSLSPIFLLLLGAFLAWGNGWITGRGDGVREGNKRLTEHMKKVNEILKKWSEQESEGEDWKGGGE